MTDSSKLLLVTGSSGFLGRAILPLALEAGWRVRTLDRNSRTPFEGTEAFFGDISDLDLLHKACEGVTAVIHAAGLAHVFGSRSRDSTLFNSVNEAGTGNVVAASVDCGVQCVVQVSSVSVYGDHAGRLCDEKAACSPRGPYAESKFRGERLAIEKMNGGKSSLTVLRLATMYGEGDRGNVARLIGALNRGRFIWLGPGRNEKSLIYKADAARACLAAAERPAGGIAIYNVSASPVTMGEIVETICEALGRPLPRLQVPLGLLNAFCVLSKAAGDPGQLGRQVEKFLHDDAYDGSNFAAAYNFEPLTSLSEGIRKEVEFLRGAR